MAKEKDKIFRFKQFALSNTQSAMKVGTDGVLLGAWADVRGVRTALDVGTGTGLIALMMAQRAAEAHITAVEIDALAADEARANVRQSPWAERVEVIEGDATRLPLREGRYDLILSNPPYFKGSLEAPNAQRNTARHEGTLTLEALMTVAARCLTDGGRIAVIVPIEREADLDYASCCARLTAVRRCYVRTKPGGVVRRLLVELKNGACGPCEVTEMVIHGSSNRGYSDDFSALTEAFYL